MIDGLTGDQRFFIAYGYSWQRKNREGALRAQLLTDPHIRRPNIGSTASSGTWTPGTRPSTSSPATRLIYKTAEERVGCGTTRGAAGGRRGGDQGPFHLLRGRCGDPQQEGGADAARACKLGGEGGARKRGEGPGG